ncbi:hypothetical protein BDA96_05G167900 [Sorghum bicolor]|uniref:Uncharacterized protein n=2 Tax=Sorghum bicolor TaxID=4558 RepID=A0A921UHL8_SORBI|nr:uncharacterized protein LOC110435289 [Sorghum bicolor]KAG0530231.1 hypothetical protein BDA96_05G167900 [Sorghum bicolor]KXG28688.1 hypothetical protein SORBI_3005G153500 [Sorghum bicolor]|eukprot:XP_021316395.1 uncharacterized protein LOC110435289 [Sorghum bicolor]
MSFSKQVAAAAFALAFLLLTSDLAVGVAVAAAGAEEETIAPLNTCETPTCIPCWGQNAICIPACVAMRFTGGFCNGKNCVCTKPCLAQSETEAGGPTQQPPVCIN